MIDPTSTVTFCLSPIDMIEAYARFRDRLMEAVALGDGRLTERSVIDALTNREFVLCHTANSAALFQKVVTKHSDVRVLFLHTAAGDLAEIEAAIPEIEAFGALWDCNRLEISGRMGWTRVLKPHGFEVSSVNMTKTIRGAADGR